MKFPKTPRGLRSRISALRSEMTKERRSFGAIRDGRGLRYVVLWLLLVLGDQEEFKKYWRWYNKNFPDDSGEPFQIFSAAIMLNRSGKIADAVVQLGELMLSNLYIIPVILGDEDEEHKFWHFSNRAWPDYAKSIPEKMKSALTDEDHHWVRTLYESKEFCECRRNFIALRHQLDNEEDVSRRSKITAKQRQLLDPIKELYS